MAKGGVIGESVTAVTFRAVFDTSESEVLGEQYAWQYSMVIAVAFVLEEPVRARARKVSFAQPT